MRSLDDFFRWLMSLLNFCDRLRVPFKKENYDRIPLKHKRSP
jgi:hypothetical protein